MIKDDRRIWGHNLGCSKGIRLKRPEWLSLRSSRSVRVAYCRNLKNGHVSIVFRI